MPSLPGHAADHGLTWKAYTGTSATRSRSTTSSTAPRTSCAATRSSPTPRTCPPCRMVWHDSPYDEHPIADVTLGHDKIWQAVDAIVAAGLWDDTVFLLTWDDWGGFDDHVVTPNLEHTPDGVQLAYGPRVPLLMFGGRVRAGIDSRWNSHVSIGKTVLDLLGLPPLGVPRLDDAPSLIDLVTATASTPAPPGFGTTITQPAPPDSPPNLTRHHRPQPGRRPPSDRWSSVTAPPLTRPTTNPSGSSIASVQRPGPHRHGRTRARRWETVMSGCVWEVRASAARFPYGHCPDAPRKRIPAGRWAR